MGDDVTVASEPGKGSVFKDTDLVQSKNSSEAWPANERASHPTGTSGAVFCTSSRAQKSVVDFTDFDEAGTGSGGNIARFEEAA